MSGHDAFREFDQSLREVLRNATEDKERIEGVRPLLQKLLSVPGLLPPAYRRPHADKYAQYLLYKPEDEAFSVIAFVWGPGQQSPVHDHLVWGLVGMYEGAIVEKRFRRVDDGSDASRAVLEEIETVTASVGDISFVYPRQADIHQVFNPFDEVAVSIHVYGTDIGKQKRHIYDLETGSIREVITRHDNTRAIYA
ncbi:MAG: hypothetical protein BAA01_15455 [Bacillus thermozeamaize]|uniref:Cysteine dioxygenase n=1 Tax=Bacillus thermozeamaize TaxID=230954 RepID=A0A1Y3PL13_9BACI|nr:MAG: hypothetical protein BAA01_15455 [Bacillus thermozeamaize]